MVFRERSFLNHFLFRIMRLDDTHQEIIVPTRLLHHHLEFLFLLLCGKDPSLEGPYLFLFLFG